jgi:hypothetical protein
MKRLVTFTLTTVALLCLIVALPAGDALAQQKQKVSFKTLPENTKYTQQHIIDAGDVPGHQVRVYEIHRTLGANAPMINGVKLKETWNRGLSDYTDNSGANTNYTVYVLENGDTFSARSTTLAQSAGGGKITTSSAGTITGGTGKLIGIQGTTRATGTADPKAGINENTTEIEYWIAK